MPDLATAVGQLTRQTPEDAATALETFYKGDARRAEVECWRLWEAVCGGSPTGRPNADTHEAIHLAHIAVVLSERARAQRNAA